VKVIYVTSIGEVEPNILELAEQLAGQWFHCSSRRMDPIPVPDDAYDPSRGQYSSVRMLHALVEKVPADAFKLAAITEKDLFIPMLSFIYGQDQLGGPVALISLARLRQEFYGMADNSRLLHERAGKEILHELGHTFSLVHCIDRTCAMTLSTNLRQLDAKGGRFCEGCTALVGERTGLETK
jgi:archaemetzincin